MLFPFTQGIYLLSKGGKHMTKTGTVNYKIKQKSLQKAYLSAIERCGVSESEFNRISIRYMISCVKETGGIPAIKNDK